MDPVNEEEEEEMGRVESVNGDVLTRFCNKEPALCVARRMEHYNMICQNGILVCPTHAMDSGEIYHGTYLDLSNIHQVMNSPHTLNWARAYQFEATEETLLQVCKEGDLDLFQKVGKLVPPETWTKSSIPECASKYGHAHILRAICTRTLNGHGRIRYVQNMYPKCAKIAAQHGHLDILLVLDEHGISFSKSVCASAAGKGHVHIVKYFLNSNLRIRGALCDAAYYGQVETFMLLLDHSYLELEESCESATSQGHVNILRKVVEKGHALDVKRLLTTARQHGKAKVENYLLSL